MYGPNAMAQSLRRLSREKLCHKWKSWTFKLPFDFWTDYGSSLYVLGIEYPVCRNILGTQQTPVTIVTARLLTLVQWRDHKSLRLAKTSGLSIFIATVLIMSVP